MDDNRVNHSFSLSELRLNFAIDIFIEKLSIERSETKLRPAIDQRSTGMVMLSHYRYSIKVVLAQKDLDPFHQHIFICMHLMHPICTLIHILHETG